MPRPSAARLHATAWSCCITLVTALGLGCALLFWRPVEVATTVGVICFLSSIGLVLITTDHESRSGGRVTVSEWVQVARRAARIGTGAMAFAGLFALSGPLALLLLVIAVVTSPNLLRRRGHQPTPGAATPPAPGGAPVAGTEQMLAAATLTALSMPELCRIWQASHASLAGAFADELSTLVAIRQACLDEIERRDPDGLHAWLESGARASGSPERFLGDSAR